MKLVLFQELLDLNRAFDQVLRGLERMERVHHFESDLVRRARADAHQEFFENFDAMVEEDASCAYEFQHDYDWKPRTWTMFISISRAAKRGARRRARRPAWPSFPAGYER
jgi:hypothetical protein